MLRKNAIFVAEARRVVVNPSLLRRYYNWFHERERANLVVQQARGFSYGRCYKRNVLRKTRKRVTYRDLPQHARACIIDTPRPQILQRYYLHS